MTIKSLRQFEKKYNKLLRKQNIIQDGKFFTKHNILDAAGFIHTIICSIKDLEDLLNRVKMFITSMLKQIKEKNEDGILYIVFDPIYYLQEESQNPFKNIKIEVIQKRAECKPINGFTVQQITQLKKNMYYYIKELFGQNENVQIIVSKLEADIMIGSLIKKIQNEDSHIIQNDTNKNITIISTDCDMYVIGYGYNVQNMRQITDTTKFFKLFGLSGKKIICCIPQYLTCDYNQKDPTHLIETLYNANLKPEGLIFDVFYQPELGEDDFQINYNKEDWYEDCENIFKIQVINEENLGDQ